MILIDANLLIYAVNSDSSHHPAARRWLEQVLSESTEVGLAWIVILAFIRITTRPGILQSPLEPDVACGFIADWLEQPFVNTIAPGPNHWPLLRNLLTATGTAGNLTSDAHLAALALEHRGAIYSADYDFQRFPGLTHVNPLVG
ncbi:MAG: type II toxin-antitoxin system VapC family toxin [Gammaproteobacteria bacterium]